MDYICSVWMAFWVCYGVWWASKGRPIKKDGMGAALIIAIVTGLIGLVHSRIVEVGALGGLLTIKTAMERAVGGAHTAESAARTAEDYAQRIGALSKRLEEEEAAGAFSRTVQSAQNDDRKAFDQLAAWARDSSNPNAHRAEQAWLSIRQAHASPMWSGGFTIPWATGINPALFDLEKLEGIYDTAPLSLRNGLLEYIWHRDDIPKRARMTFLAKVLAHEQSLRVLEYAGRYFRDGAGLSVDPLAVEEMRAWWEENSESAL